jgi:hypothetical protein
VCIAGFGNAVSLTSYLLGKFVFLYQKFAGNGKLPFGYFPSDLQFVRVLWLKCDYVERKTQVFGVKRHRFRVPVDTFAVKR